ncbi:regulatory protein RecX [Arthrobacter sp. MDB2-24]
MPGPGSAPSGDPSGGTEPSRSDEDWASEARSILLRQLALGARSRHQLARKLADREIPAAVAAALLDRFEEVQLIDDAEFARMWVRTRTAAKALSRSSLRRELADKGIDPDLAEDALLQVSDEDEHAQARDVVRRKLRGSADPADRAVRDKEVRRLVGILARKGYSPGTAFSIVKDVLAEAEAQD